jgi:hypothetical protein
MVRQVLEASAGAAATPVHISYSGKPVDALLDEQAKLG